MADAAAVANPNAARNERLAAGLILLAAALPRIWAAWSDQGVFWPDELFQNLEQAHRFAFGFGLRPWEFRLGARSWVLPGAIGLWMKLLATLGMNSAPALVRGAKLLMAALSLVGVAGAMSLARALGGTSAMLVAGALAGFFPAQLIYGSRTMSETASGPLVVWATALLVRGGPRRLAAAGVLTAVAVFIRYQVGVLAVGLLIFLLVARRGRGWKPFLVAAVVTALALGLVLDVATWGKPFWSFREYVKFNLIEGKASNWGIYPPSFYAKVLATSTGPTIWVLAGGLLLALRRAPLLTLVALSFVWIHMEIPHKELRFLMPVAPLALALAGVGLGTALDLLPAPRIAAAILATALGLLGGLRAQDMTFGEMGQWLGEARQSWSAWHRCEDVNRLFWEASTHDDLCGVMIAGSMWQGGYAYLHRDVPILWGAGATEQTQANYLVAPKRDVTPGFAPIAEDGDFALLRREGGCAPPGRGFSHDMPGP
jgi:phosphatidylinositol glycan class B